MKLTTHTGPVRLTEKQTSLLVFLVACGLKIGLWSAKMNLEVTDVEVGELLVKLGFGKGGPPIGAKPGECAVKITIKESPGSLVPAGLETKTN